MRRLIREWRAGKWVLLCTYLANDPRDNLGRPMLHRLKGLSVRGTVRWSPFISIHRNPPRLNETPTWKRLVLNPNRDANYLMNHCSLTGIAPHWTLKGDSAKFFRIRLS